MAISKRLRYEILRRDQHTCRYCGDSAPDVKLTVDHVLPVALGGSDDPTNLVAACGPCNSGKSSSSPDAPLVADVEEKALIWRRALALAVERREVEYRDRELLLDFFETEWDGWCDAPSPKDSDWRSTVTQFTSLGITPIEFSDAIDVAYRSRASHSKVWSYFCGVCWNKVRQIEQAAQQLIESGEVN